MDLSKWILGRYFLVWYLNCGRVQRMAFPSPNRPEEATMSPKKRRKIYGVRRETRRPRGWTRWFLEGLMETESSGSVRVRTVLWGHQ